MGVKEIFASRKNILIIGMGILIVILLVVIIILINKESSNKTDEEYADEYICTYIEYGTDDDNFVYDKNIIEIEQENGEVSNINTISIAKEKTLKNAEKSKYIYDSNLCDIGNYLYCESWIDEDDYTVIEYNSFDNTTLQDGLKYIDDYISFIENNGYKCNKMIIKK